MKSDRYFLELALLEATKALGENTYPIGSVIADDKGDLVTKGRNRVHPMQDATAHAEIDAIRNAGKSILNAKVNHERLTIYTTLEPCPMCTGAILFANIKRVIWLVNDDMGFGGYRKIQGIKEFDRRFREIEVIQEPFDDLKEKQMELMKLWSSNPNHVAHLRKEVF